MAKLSFSITSAIGTVTFDSPTLTDAQMLKFLDYIWATFPQLNVDGTPKPRTNANLADAYRAWAATIWAGTKDAVLDFGRGAALAAIVAMDT